MAARMFPANCPRPASIARVRCGEKKVRMIPTPNTTATRSIITFGVSKRKNFSAWAMRLSQS